LARQVGPEDVAASVAGRRTREWRGPAPLARQVGPEDVAASVMALLESDTITGQIVFADAGQHLL